jgi:hypothetical protein
MINIQLGGAKVGVKNGNSEMLEMGKTRTGRNSSPLSYRGKARINL